MAVFTPEQKKAIQKIVGASIAGTVALVALLQVQVNDLSSRVTALEQASPTPAPSPTTSPTTSPTATPTATTSPTAPPTATPTTSPTQPPTPTPTPSPSPPGPVVIPPAGTGPGGGVFSVSCNWDHVAPDDPIVFPGQPSTAHLHDFFGSIGVNAFTTVQSLLGSPTTCEHPSDSAAYWAPALINVATGKLYQPTNVLAYYQGASNRPVRAFPPGLVMIADIGTGNAVQTKTGFGCVDNSNMQPTPENLRCPDSYVKMHVHFPMFWNGTSLDSPDHRSHMSYVKDAAHPYELIHLHIHVQYRGLKSGAGYRLVQNPNGTIPVVHSDFMNGWDQAVLQRITKTCINDTPPGREDCKKFTEAGLP